MIYASRGMEVPVIYAHEPHIKNKAGNTVAMIYVKNW